MAEIPETARPQRAKAIVRQQKCLELRVAGATYRQISKALTEAGTPCGVKTAFQDVQRAIRAIQKYTHEQAETLKQLEIDRLDNLMMALWNKATATNPDVKAAMACLRIMESRRTLLGLDAPPKLPTPMESDIPYEFTLKIGARSPIPGLPTIDIDPVKSFPVQTNGNGKNGNG